MRFYAAWPVAIRAHATVISLPPPRGSYPVLQLALTLLQAFQAKVTRISNRPTTWLKNWNLPRHTFSAFRLDKALPLPVCVDKSKTRSRRHAANAYWT